MDRARRLAVSPSPRRTTDSPTVIRPCRSAGESIHPILIHPPFHSRSCLESFQLYREPLAWVPYRFLKIRKKNGIGSVYRRGRPPCLVPGAWHARDLSPSLSRCYSVWCACVGASRVRNATKASSLPRAVGLSRARATKARCLGWGFCGLVRGEVFGFVCWSGFVYGVFIRFWMGECVERSWC